MQEEEEDESRFQTPVYRGTSSPKSPLRSPPGSSIRPVRRLGGEPRHRRRVVVTLRDPSDTPPPPAPSSSSPPRATKGKEEQEEQAGSPGFTFDASMNLDNLDPSDPVDAMLVEIEQLFASPAKRTMEPKALFPRELHSDNWELHADDVRDVEEDLNRTIHDSLSMEVSPIQPGANDHDEEVQHVLDMQMSREYEQSVYYDDKESGEDIILDETMTTTRHRPILGMRRDLQTQPAAREQEEGQRAPQPARRPPPAFEIYVPNDSADELNADTSLSILDDGRRSKMITLKNMQGATTPLRIRANPGGKTRAAVTRFALKIISVAEQNPNHTSVGIRTWNPHVHNNGNTHWGVTFTFEHAGSSYGRRFPSLMGISESPKHRMHPFQPPVGLFTLHASMFPNRERMQRDPGDGMPSVNSLFVTPPGSFVTVLCPVDSRFLKSIDHVVLELTYIIHGQSQTLMRLAVHKAVFAGLLFYDQKTVVIPRVPVTETMDVDIKLHVRVRQKTTRGDQVMIVAVEKAEFTVPYGFEGILREKIV